MSARVDSVTPAGNSPLHRLDARVKLVMALIYMVSCFFANGTASLALACAVMLGAIACARMPLGRFLARLAPVALMLAITSLFNLLFVHTGETVLAAGPFVVSTGGITAAVRYTLRFALLVSAGVLLTLTTAPTVLMAAVTRMLAPLGRIGVASGQVALTLSIALRFVPILQREAHGIVAAQTARGAQFENAGVFARARAYVPLVVPLFAGSLRHAERLAQAMDVRGYTGGRRTSYHEMRLRARRDGAAIAVFAVYLLSLAALALAGF